MAEVQPNSENPSISPEQIVADKMFPTEIKSIEVTPEVTKPEEKLAVDPPPIIDEKPIAKPLEDIKDVVLPKDSMLSQVELDSALAFAKENGLTNKQAQDLINKQNEQLNTFVKSQVDTFQTKIASYENAIKADKEIGGLNFDKSLSFAKRVVEKFGTEDLRKEFDSTGFGSHPEVIRLLARIGSTISDDALIMPGAKSAPSRSAEEVIYGRKN